MLAIARKYIHIVIVACLATVVISACNPGQNSTTTTTTTQPASTASPASSTNASGAHSGHSMGKKININTAILSELDKLEAKLGVPALSNKIQAERPYKTTEDLVTKKVIDRAQFDSIKDLVTIEEIALQGVEKDADYMVKLGLMKGHLDVAKELLVLNKPKDAEPHIGHPVEEIYADVADQLSERKVKDFKNELLALQDLVKAGSKDNAKIDTNFKLSVAAVDNAISALPATQRKSPAFVLQVINGLLDTANSEYGAAIANGKIKAAIEYQDSRGFINYVNALYREISADMSKQHPDAHKQIAANLASLKPVWPQVIPPAAAVKSPAEVGKLITEIEQNTQKIIAAGNK